MLHKIILMQTGEDKAADFKKGGEAADRAAALHHLAAQ